jgi:hypothetical protein
MLADECFMEAEFVSENDAARIFVINLGHGAGGRMKRHPEESDLHVNPFDSGVGATPVLIPSVSRSRRIWLGEIGG